MDDAEIAAELQSIQERLGRLAEALKARTAPSDPEALRSISRISTDELDALTNEEIRRLSEKPE